MGSTVLQNARDQRQRITTSKSPLADVADPNFFDEDRSTCLQNGESLKETVGSSAFLTITAEPCGYVASCGWDMLLGGLDKLASNFPLNEIYLSLGIKKVDENMLLIRNT